MTCRRLITTIVKDRRSHRSAKDINRHGHGGITAEPRPKRAGLIDRVAYPDTLRDELAKSIKPIRSLL